MDPIIFSLNIYNLISLGVALFLLTMWFQFALFPDRFIYSYFKETIDTPAGRNEIRAMVGGSNLGLSMILFIGAFMPQFQSLAFLAVGIVGSAIGWTRVVFLLKDRPHTLFNRIDATVEPLGSLALIGLYFSMS